MKQLLTSAGFAAMLLLCAVFCQAQSFQSLLNQNCGTWKDTVTYSDWVNIDTLSKQPIKDTLREWVYDEYDEPLESNSYNYAVYCPCGCMWDSNWWQYRVCKLTGIKQRRLKTQSWTMIPPPPKPKTEYEKTIDSLGVSK